MIMIGAAGNGLGATINDLRQSKSGAAGIGLGATFNDLRCATSGVAVYGLSTTITYLRGAERIGKGCTTKYLRRSARQRPGHNGQVPATKYVRRAVQRPGPISETTDVPLHYRRPSFALLCACLLRQQAKQHYRGPGIRCPWCLCPNSLAVSILPVV
jgi:hypothetical protein